MIYISFQSEAGGFLYFKFSINGKCCEMFSAAFLLIFTSNVSRSKQNDGDRGTGCFSRRDNWRVTSCQKCLMGVLYHMAFTYVALRGVLCAQSVKPIFKHAFCLLVCSHEDVDRCDLWGAKSGLEEIKMPFSLFFFFSPAQSTFYIKDGLKMYRINTSA